MSELGMSELAVPAGGSPAIGTETAPARCASCGRPLPSPYASCAPCTGIVDPGPWPPPVVAPQPSSVLRATRGLVRPRRHGVSQAVSDDLTSVAVVAGLLACLAGLVGTSMPFATVSGVTTTLSEDASAGVVMVLVSIVGLLTLFIARLPSGWGVGALAAVVSGIPLVHLRAVAVTLGDGSEVVTWESGFIVLGFASVVALAPLLCAISGLRRGQQLGRVPIWAMPVPLAAVAVIAWWRWDSVVAVAGDLGGAARLALSSVLAGELVMLSLAVAMRSRLGGGVFVGAAVLPLAYWAAESAGSDVAFDLIDPTRLLTTAGVLAGTGLLMTVLAVPVRPDPAAPGRRSASRSIR